MTNSRILTEFRSLKNSFGRPRASFHNLEKGGVQVGFGLVGDYPVDYEGLEKLEFKKEVAPMLNANGLQSFATDEDYTAIKTTEEARQIEDFDAHFIKEFNGLKTKTDYDRAKEIYPELIEKLNKALTDNLRLEGIKQRINAYGPRELEDYMYTYLKGRQPGLIQGEQWRGWDMDEDGTLKKTNPGLSPWAAVNATYKDNYSKPWTTPADATTSFRSGSGLELISNFVGSKMGRPNVALYDGLSADLTAALSVAPSNAALHVMQMDASKLAGQVTYLLNSDTDKTQTVALSGIANNAAFSKANGNIVAKKAKDIADQIKLYPAYRQAIGHVYDKLIYIAAAMEKGGA